MGVINIHDAGRWKGLGAAWARDGGVWKPADEIWFRYNGNWVKMFDATPDIGDEYQGGYFVGQIASAEDGIATHNIVASPKAAEAVLFFSDGTIPSGIATSLWDGKTNTDELEPYGYPSVTYCTGLTFGGYDDWYLPAIKELELVFYSFKPNTDNNWTTGTTNTYAVPPRTTAYTLTVPGQTSFVNFQQGNSEAFDAFRVNSNLAVYRSSTVNSPTETRSLIFFWTALASANVAGFQEGYGIFDFIPVRPFRRVAL